MAILKWFLRLIAFLFFLLFLGFYQINVQEAANYDSTSEEGEE